MEAPRATAVRTRVSLGPKGPGLSRTLPSVPNTVQTHLCGVIQQLGCPPWPKVTGLSGSGLRRVSSPVLAAVAEPLTPTASHTGPRGGWGSQDFKVLVLTALQVLAAAPGVTRKLGRGWPTEHT